MRHLPNERTFQVKGVIVGLNPAAKSVEIRHEAIPGYMPAMTMSFDVRTTNNLAMFGTNDAITFRLVVTDDKRPARSVRNLVSVELKSAE